jgi:hypothetical protein
LATRGRTLQYLRPKAKGEGEARAETEADPGAKVVDACRVALLGAEGVGAPLGAPL